MRRRVFVITVLALVIFDSISITMASPQYEIDTFKAEYVVMGKVPRSLAAISVNMVSTLLFNVTEQECHIEIANSGNYSIYPTNYSIELQKFVLSKENITSGYINDVKLSTGTETNIFYDTYGLDYYEATFDNPVTTYTFKWEKNTGIAIWMYMTLKNQVYGQLTYRLTWCSLNLYESYEHSRVELIKFIKSIASPEGFMLLFSIIFLFIIGVAIQATEKKTKTRIPPREARVMTST